MRRKRIFFLIALAILSALVLGSFIRTGIDGFKQAMFNDMIYGKAWKPFVCRILTPTLIRHVPAVLPHAVRDRLDRYTVLGGIRLTEFSAAVFIQYLSLLGFAWVFMRFTRSFYRLENTFLYPATLATITGLPVFFKFYSHLYDFPQLFLFTLCLCLLVEKKWVPYLIFFGIAMLNKETSILLLLLFILNRPSTMAKRSFVSLIAAQLVIFAIVKIAISIRFMGNPGGVVEWHLYDNLFMKPYSIGQFTAFVIIAVAVFHHWKHKHPFLKRSLWILAPLLVATLFFGHLDEYRDYYEVYPIVALLILHSIAEVLGIPEFALWNERSPS